jgi:YidC/Oxa1 family membrane protein insertase
MQAIQPDIEKLKKKYANDPQKLSMEQRKLMKERGVSTLGGCLPMLIMMPLLFMFFAAFRAWSNQQTLDLMMRIDAGQGVQAFAASRFLWITNIWRPDNLNAGGTLMNGQEFWNTFAAGNNVKDFIFFNNHSDALSRILYELHFFTRTIGEDGTIQYVLANDGGAAFKAAYETFVSPITQNTDLIGGGYERMSNGFAILPILAGATTFLSSWLTQRSQKKAMQKNGDGKDDPANQAQSMNKVMMFLMPAMSIFFCYQYDSTFAFYWIFSNVISLAITLILNATVFKKMQQGTVEVIKK